MITGHTIPRVVLADDHPIVRYGVRMALEEQNVATIVGEAGSASELLSLLATVECDIIVTDFSMPDVHGRDGLSLIARLRRTYPDLPVVVITALRNPGILDSLLRRGVLGLVEKGGNITELQLALRATAKGRRFVSRDLRTLLTVNDVGPKQKAPRLTNAEIEILRLFAYDGLTSQQISERLNRSRKTISRHKRNAQAKLGLATNQDLLDYCREVDLTAR